MKMPQEFGENLDIAYHWFAKLVASEGAEVTDHAKRMTLARRTANHLCCIGGK